MDAERTLERKHLLRQAALERRNCLPAAEAYLRSQRIEARVLALNCFRTASAVAIYSSFQNEDDTFGLLDQALTRGKQVFLPRSLGDEFLFAQISSRAELAAGRFGIFEPIRATVLTASDKTDLIIFVPGVAFDIQGNRLGRGAGSYDRFLAPFSGSACLVGLAYEFQIIAAVPVQSWDCAMRFIVTEKRTIDCVTNLRQSGAGKTGIEKGVF
jgi:5-formyltetrahydrofolate cyclo-ligase